MVDAPRLAAGASWAETSLGVTATVPIDLGALEIREADTTRPGLPLCLQTSRPYMFMTTWR